MKFRTILLIVFSCSLYHVKAVATALPNFQACIAYPVNDIHTCDDDNNGYADFTFNIIDIENQVLGGQTGLTVSYFDDLGNPIALASPFTNTTIHQQTITVRVSDGMGCTDETTFDFIVDPIPKLDFFTDVTICGSFTLKALSPGGGNYFTGPGGTGTMLFAGDIITTTQTIYVYAERGTPPYICTAEASFTVTIYEPPVDDLSDVSACDSYTLQPLTDGDYYTGTGGTGTMLNAGDVITTSQTVYIYAETGTPPDTCSNESSFTITIYTTPTVDVLADEAACDSYTLPPLTVGNYFTGPNGTGTQLNAGDIITASQTIYIYAETGTTPNCSDESSFTITIYGSPIVDVLADEAACDSYTLQPLTNGNYFTGPNGTGTQLNAGDIITTSQTIYIYVQSAPPANCSNESSFNITIYDTPTVDTLADEAACDSYTLTSLTVGNYFTGPNGTGTPLNAGDVITTTQTLYVYVETGTTPNCFNESSFTITIYGSPIVDVLADEAACDSYTLQPLTNGNYFTGPNGTGTPLNAGDIITTSQTIYIYVQLAPPANCSNESSFNITIYDTPTVDTLADEDACDSYTLLPLTVGNYFTGPNGTGAQLNAGDIITASQTIYIYVETGTTPNCFNESSFTITIYGSPIVDVLADEAACDSYTLQPLTNGNYFTGPNGTGTQLNAGDIITTSQTIYIFAQTTTPIVCSNESSFDLTINPSVDFSLTASNLTITLFDIVVNMTDTSIIYEYAVDLSPYQSNNEFFGLTEGLHTLYVRDNNGCVVKSLVFLIRDTRLRVPKFFTPNNDRYNDFWQVKDPENTVSSIHIFDRYGKLLKQLSPYSPGWDGKYNNQLLEVNDYWYLITLRDNTQIKGHFTLKR